MKLQKCYGLEVASGAAVEISYGGVLEGVDHLVGEAAVDGFVAPGFIDLQVNGFAGCDYNDPDAAKEEIARSIQAMYTTGVTRFYPTVITGSPERIFGALRNLAKAKETLAEGTAMEGFHVEGPHISPEDGPRGAHPLSAVRPPDIAEYRRWQDAAGGLVRLITISPEWPGANAYIEEVVRDGVVVSIGHTKAGADQIADAVKAGATMSTHLGNGAHSVLPRHPNYIWEQLAEDRLAASFIVDGIHLANSFLKVALRAKGIERSVLVTDAVMPAGCAPGPYRLGEVEVELHEDQSVRLKGGSRLAGSALRMDQGVENLVNLAGLTLTEAVSMATRNPARVGRISGRHRGLSPGERADLVRFRFDMAERRLHILETIVGGESVYQAAA
jgi:N-acetylglucosamine-6-phosphate deacetylase